MANNTYNNLKDVFTSKKVTQETKFRLLQALVESIFMYNCELWTLTQSLSDQIDVIHHWFIRRILNIKWYERIKHEEVYSLSKCKKWSDKIKCRRISWFGHLCRLPDGAPANSALFESLKPCDRPQGSR